MPDVNCFHLTCACTDEQMRRKITTRGYRQSIVPFWYRRKWQNWKPGMKDLHPVNPPLYQEAVEFDKRLLPSHLRTHRFYQ